ncbi:MAG TPA: SDR family NAD(P)-dependent oxidoreductase [Acidimicrobiia bacterium]|jgi:NAD(P)-dependent dehydrogenase (short-subunit alcohol dehydrogenase family)|nr:SDR family NAD(P)-dependent oxidoreductase [Acidimicrobiia bacterium]
MELEGKVALVTGASRGVGAATAVALAAQGCDVACAARSTTDAPQRTPGTLEETAARVEALGRRALIVPTNLADADEVVAMVRATEEAFGRVDILVNNAAITFVGDLDIPLKRHDLVMEVNLRAPLIACRSVVPGMKDRGEGAILNVSSNAALYPHPGIMSYGISKIGLERLTVDLARQLQEWSIAVNCFRIDVAVASEGFIANTPGVDRSTWEPAEVAAEGIVWMLRQPPSYSGRRESMYALRHREGIMASRAQEQREGPPPVTELLDGLAPPAETTFREPYPDEPKENVP